MAQENVWTKRQVVEQLKAKQQDHQQQNGSRDGGIGGSSSSSPPVSSSTDWSRLFGSSTTPPSATGGGSHNKSSAVAAGAPLPTGSSTSTAVVPLTPEQIAERKKQKLLKKQQKREEMAKLTTKERETLAFLQRQAQREAALADVEKREKIREEKHQRSEQLWKTSAKGGKTADNHFKRTELVYLSDLVMASSSSSPAGGGDAPSSRKTTTTTTTTAGGSGSATAAPPKAPSALGEEEKKSLLPAASNWAKKKTSDQQVGVEVHVDPTPAGTVSDSSLKKEVAKSAGVKSAKLSSAEAKKAAATTNKTAAAPGPSGGGLMIKTGIVTDGAKVSGKAAATNTALQLKGKQGKIAVNSASDKTLEHGKRGKERRSKKNKKLTKMKILLYQQRKSYFEDLQKTVESALCKVDVEALDSIDEKQEEAAEREELAAVAEGQTPGEREESQEHKKIMEGAESSSESENEMSSSSSTGTSDSESSDPADSAGKDHLQQQQQPVSPEMISLDKKLKAVKAYIEDFELLHQRLVNKNKKLSRTEEGNNNKEVTGGEQEESPSTTSVETKKQAERRQRRERKKLTYHNVVKKLLAQREWFDHLRLEAGSTTTTAQTLNSSGGQQSASEKVNVKKARSVPQEPVKNDSPAQKKAEDMEAEEEDNTETDKVVESLHKRNYFPPLTVFGLGQHPFKAQIDKRPPLAVRTTAPKFTSMVPQQQSECAVAATSQNTTQPKQEKPADSIVVGDLGQPEGETEASEREGDAAAPAAVATTKMPREKTSSAKDVNERQQLAREVFNERTRPVRNYVHNVLTQELDDACYGLLKKLNQLQVKVKKTMAVEKQKRHQRFMTGLKETIKGINSHRIRLIVIAPDFEPTTGPRGIDDHVQQILSLCHQNKTPCIFALHRKALGSALNLQRASVTSVAVINGDGAYEELKKVVQLGIQCRAEYEQIVTPPSPEALDDDGEDEEKKEVEEKEDSANS